MDDSAGGTVERRMEHENGEVHNFYGGLPKPVRVVVAAWLVNQKQGTRLHVEHVTRPLAVASVIDSLHVIHRFEV